MDILIPDALRLVFDAVTAAPEASADALAETLKGSRDLREMARVALRTDEVGYLRLEPDDPEMRILVDYLRFVRDFRLRRDPTQISRLAMAVARAVKEGHIKGPDRWRKGYALATRMCRLLGMVVYHRFLSWLRVEEQRKGNASTPVAYLFPELRTTLEGAEDEDKSLYYTSATFFRNENYLMRPRHARTISLVLAARQNPRRHELDELQQKLESEGQLTVSLVLYNFSLLPTGIASAPLTWASGQEHIETRVALRSTTREYGTVRLHFRNEPGKTPEIYVDAIECDVEALAMDQMNVDQLESDVEELRDHLVELFHDVGIENYRQPGNAFYSAWYDDVEPVAMFLLAEPRNDTNNKELALRYSVWDVPLLKAAMRGESLPLEALQRLTQPRPETGKYVIWQTPFLQCEGCGSEHAPPVAFDPASGAGYCADCGAL